ncbi:hypothetical protein Ddye_008216 [Dipteronia dyeriana]|uniref:BZIP domain-containing protein n=1 Tax=Dipteronia dyeriana TaxID=168575 RepID=A0AAE0CL52_9ROSI|nr:hypothetical protein Ddye_008216 [Dipteronia dyeriana]
MDLEDCSVSGSSSSSSLPSSAAGVVEDRMVEMELEAAEALADLAHLAMRETGTPETANNWGNKGKRVRKRVKSESPSSHSGLDLNLLDPATRSSDPADDQAIMDQQQDQTMHNNVIIALIKTEEAAESLKPSPSCTPRYTSTGGGRSRQNLTEAEKEERRIRRILANRESARQTIRRRQALCEELTRKATELVQENEYLKRVHSTLFLKEKELAVKDYQSLETINKHLKAQVAAKAIKTEVGGELKSVNLEKSTSQPANFPLLLYNHHPFSPLGWPPVVQSQHPVHLQQGTQNAITIPSSIPNTGNLDPSHEQENHRNINSTGAPLYLLPCPWYFPLHDNVNGFHAHQPTYGLKNTQDETSMRNGEGTSSSSRSIAHVENHPLSMPKKIKNEAFGSMDARTINDLKVISVGCLPDGGGLHTGSHPREAKLTHAPLCSVGGAFIVRHENAHAHHTDCTCKAEDIASVLPDKKQEPVSCPSKNLVDAGAAAKARKRRKELTKLKNLHGRQCRMQC